MQKKIKAPLTGVVIEVAVSVDQAVTKGELLVLLESMKVQLRVEADSDGLVRGVFAAVGDTIQRDATLVSLEANSITNADDVNVDSSIGASPHSLIQEFYDRQALSLDQHRSDAALKRHSKGYQTARENLARLCDPTSFQEYGQFAVAAQRQRHDYQTLKTSSAADGIITGIGQVNGQSVALVVNDYSVMAGTQGYFHHQKLDRILAVARDKKLPVIMFTEGGGGRPGVTDVKHSFARLIRSAQGSGTSMS
ncbi:MAG: hypothetical protein JKX81_06875 [Arenicella sp.]|nr:hypothetical protein [Arenicella sp.]